MAKAPAPMDNQVVISRDMDYEGYYDVYTISSDKKEMKVTNLHDINWPNTRNNESTDISSFQLGKGLAITVHSEYDLGGESKRFERSELDLRRHLMTDGKNNWNNEIKSFIIHQI